MKACKRQRGTKASWQFRRALIRSFQPAAASLLHEFQTNAIVALAIIDWMLWAIRTYGTLGALVLTVPTSLPAVMWADRRRAWLDRKNHRGLLDRARADGPDDLRAE